MMVKFPTFEEGRNTWFFGGGILRSLSITMKHLLSRAVTVQYPHEKISLPPRSRGALKLRGAIDEKTLTTLSLDEMPPCQTACPANVDARGYIGLLAQKKYAEAYSLHFEANPMPATIGRICPHPCEDACRRGEEDEAVTICALKRFMADNVSREQRKELFQRPKTSKGKKVAIVGAGPAGLSCAYYLARCGYEVTIFDRLPVAGGMLAVAIPTYRLPEPVLNAEIEQILSLGIELKLNTPIGDSGLSLDDLFKEGYKAIFLAIGAHKPMELGIEGEHLEGVLPGENFLREYRLGKKLDLGEKVAVIGGGNTAIDCARIALRLGVRRVSILYRRSRAEMPALESEINDAALEGINFGFLVAPSRIIGSNGRVKAIECIRTELGPPDERGRRRPIPVKGSEHIIEVDTVIPAISRIPETEWLKESGLEISRKGTIVADPLTGATSREGVYAGGDVVTGPSIAIDAIGWGRRAAEAIDIYLSGKPDEYWRKKFPREKTIKMFYLEDEERAEAEKLPPAERIKSFDEVEKTFSEKVALAQAQRCLNCMTQRCIGCYLCQKACPTRAITIQTSQNGSRKIENYEIDYGRCQFCKICVDTCPTKTLIHTTKYELADYTRQSVIYNKKKLLKV